MASYSQSLVSSGASRSCNVQMHCVATQRAALGRRKRPVTGAVVNQASIGTLPIEATGYESRVVGAFLGSMCGNVLGGHVQNDKHWMVTKQHSRGLTDFFAYDLYEEPLALGEYTGDLCGMLAVARCLIQNQGCDADAMVSELLRSCPPQRRYSRYERRLLALLAVSSEPWLMPAFVDAEFQQQISYVQSSGRRAALEPYGPEDHGGAARIAPLALAYRHAPLVVLRDALGRCLAATHPGVRGLEGALVQAEAVRWLSSRNVGDEGVTPDDLLTHLAEVALTENMKYTILLVRENLLYLPKIDDWGRWYRSAEWLQLTKVLSAITRFDFATYGTEAAAVALLAMCSSWEEPEQAVIMAASFGGSAPITAQMTGALAGSLHGHAWVPLRWWNKLENKEEDGRDAVVALASRLAELDCTEPPAWKL